MRKISAAKKTVLIAISAVILVSAGLVGKKVSDNYFEISKNLEIFTTLYRELNIYYVDETNPGELMKTGIDAMLKSLDPYTNFIPESDMEDYRFMTTGQYGGIGSLIRSVDKEVYISEPYEGFPAQKSGLMAGDRILKVDGIDVTGKDQEEISKILKGQSGTKVVITVQRHGANKPETFEVVREEIKIPDVPYYGMLDDEVGYIKLTSFTHTAGKDVKDAFLKLKKEHGMKKVILDLRGNGGGLLRESVNIVNMFVPKGEEVVSTKGKITEWDKVHKAINEPVDTEMPLVILVNESSASASEIVAGCIQDLDRGVVIGQNTFGKGLVQQTRELYYNTKLKLTVAKYYIPSGRCIQRLDYAHKDEDGNVTSFPDSLLNKFSTRNGRLLTDGRGIDPDILVEDEKLHKILLSLLEKQLFFKYANDYRLKHASIAPATEFTLTDNEYAEFKELVLKNDVSYTTSTEKAYEKLLNTARDEEYFNDAEKEFEALKAKIKPYGASDMERFRHDIQLVLENEIISRYYYQTGRIQATLAKDRSIETALEVFNNGTYRDILSVNYTGK
jgi:carboxyl-terminal processing protease